MTALTATLGVLAGVIGVADTIPYVRDVLRGTTRPHRGTWLIWSALTIVVGSSQWADGASWSLILPVVQAIMISLVFTLALRHGQGGVTVTDLVVIAVAATGVAGWLLVDEPIVATVCVVVADLIGAALMVPKTHHTPGSETLATFGWASVSGALAAGAVGAADLALLLYPIYFCLVNGAIALLIVHRRAVLRATPAIAGRAVGPSGSARGGS